MTPGSNAERFERLAVPHLDAVHGLAGWLTGDPAEAADLTQDTYLRAFRFFDQVRSDDIKPWLLKILRNTHYSRRKAARHEPALTSYDDAEAEVALATVGANGGDVSANDPEALLLKSEDRDIIRRAMADLTEDQRMILILRETEDLSYKKIVEILEIRLGTVMSRLARARKSLCLRVVCLRKEAGNGSR